MAARRPQRLEYDHRARGNIHADDTGANEDADATGDLDVKGTVTIKGAGSTKTLVNANGLDRVFEVLGGNVTIQKLTIEGGLATTGGGLLNIGGKVTLSSVIVANNTAQGTVG